MAHLQELVEFLHHDNQQIKAIALEQSAGLTGDINTNLQLFLHNNARAVTDLKQLSSEKLYEENALKSLINLTQNEQIRLLVLKDKEFLLRVVVNVTSQNSALADLYTMLLCNITKHYDGCNWLCDFKLQKSEKFGSDLALNQLIDCFVRDGVNSVNKNANFDYVAYILADISRIPKGRSFLTNVQSYDSVLPISKLIVFTDHERDIRRMGVASIIKNIAFEVILHEVLLDPCKINVLPFILLPLCGPEEFSEEDMDSMLEDLQFLPSDKKRDPVSSILLTHVETLLLLATSREGREQMRAVKVYPVVRELHLNCDNEEVQDACERLVQLIMGDEENEVNELHKESDNEEELVEIV